ncbi:winged helix-turn-helix transcriptional regulator [Methanobacterium alkalithermotolerans]|uniref:Winged helix-turn-helix transcriptional regulator n=1 Tax=Methanobacterium alkalithermotolerans TaxID=2731220 RepID=A0A8T8KBC3_9EURY|nr:metalloregulator ArsR/SmtB family transcription factor [Methanobacterium alkalithermotolerans]QUH22701.1 winged helix-turn-helix transcriptional regulator [Methanobacterium alkalithermotolerans]
MKSCATDESSAEKLIKLRQGLPSDENLYATAEVLKALADPTRLKILHLLKNGELCACEIIEVLDKPQPTVSHHLTLLKNAGFLKWRKEGVWIHYQLSHPDIMELVDQIMNNIH